MQSSDEPQEDCFISNLPNEVLSEIFSYFPRDFIPENSVCRKGDSYRFTLVCRRWARVYGPILFSKICLADRGRPGLLERQIRGLLKILEARPYLQSYPRRFLLAYQSDEWRNDEVWPLTAKVIEYCKGTRSIVVQPEFTAESWPFISAIKNLPFLEVLELRDPSVYLIFQHLNLPSLKCLRLLQYGLGENSDPMCIRGKEPTSITQDDLDALLPPDRYHTGSVTCLMLKDSRSPGIVSEIVLRLPARLEKLQLEWPGSVYHRADQIQRMLDIHRQSLKTIILDEMNSMPDFSNFPCLERLKLYADDVLIRETPSSAFEKLAIPSLRWLSMETTPKYNEDEDEDHQRDFEEFTEERFDWMKDFISHMKSLPNSSLEEVFIGFFTFLDPNDGFYDELSIPSAWPWHFLEKLRKETSQPGFSFEYEEPTWTKEAWDEVMLDNDVDPTSLPLPGE